MIDTFEIEWKIGGLLPAPIRSDCKYYQQHEDHGYAKRVFGRPDLMIPSSTLVPTKLFHQALNGELAKKYDLNEAIHKLPYRFPIGELGTQQVNLRFRVFDENIMVLTIHLPQIQIGRTISELIELQILSSNPILESIAHFCFNVHYCPVPSQVAVKGLLSRPLMKIWGSNDQLSQSSLVELVTRHEGINMRASEEMISKNESLNFNKDLLLLDKQGVVFFCVTSDKDNQRNRYNRISSLYEYSVHTKSVESILLENSTAQEMYRNVEYINKVLTEEVLSQSVGAKRSWNLIKSEFKLDKTIFNSYKTSSSCKSVVKKTSFYRDPIFIGFSTLVVLIASVATIYQVFSKS